MTKFPRRSLPSHTVLRSFESAARHKSFTLAAEELHLTQSAVSRQIKELEYAVGTELFRRTGRKVELTTAGENLAADLTIDLENIRRTIMRAISAGAEGSTLRVACLPTFASRWLVPRLTEFARLHPEIELNLSTRLKPFDLHGEHFDLAIHYGQADWPAADMVHFCSETMIAVASPEFRDLHQINRPEDIANAPILHLLTRPTAWMDFFGEQQLEFENLKQGKYFDQFSMIIAGAVASLGAGLLPIYLIEKELRDGTLVRLSPISISTDKNYYLVTPAGQCNNSVNTLCQWMFDCLKE